MDSHFCFQSHGGDPHRRHSTPVFAAKPYHQNNSGTTHTCCSSNGVHGCGCGCRCCTCRHNQDKDESNRTAYPSQGSQRAIDIPRTGTADYHMRGSSLDSTSSSQSQISNNSHEVQHNINHSLSMEDFDENTHVDRATATIANFTVAFDAQEEEEDQHPYLRFISPSNSPSDDYSDLSFENMNGSSMVVGLDDSESGMASTLSMYASAWQHSMTASQVLTGAGESLPVRNNFLRLTPECRHERTRQMCRVCMHY